MPDVAGQLVVGRGMTPGTPLLADFPADTVERLLPRLLEMQRSTAEILHAQAATTRMRAQARAKEDEAQRRREAGQTRPRPSRPADHKSGETGRKAAAAEAEGTGEVVSLPVRGRRHG